MRPINPKGTIMTEPVAVITDLEDTSKTRKHYLKLAAVSAIALTAAAIVVTKVKKASVSVETDVETSA